MSSSSSTKTMLLLPFCCFIILFCLTSPSVVFQASATKSAAASTAAICKSTPDPAYCRSVLLPTNNNSNTNIYDYGRFSVRKSISQAKRFSSMINKYLSRKSQLSIPAVRALEDCMSLADLNLEFLISTFSAVSSTSKTLSSWKAEDVQTLLSAILTNQHTCLDGISSTASAWKVRNLDHSTPFQRYEALQRLARSIY